MTTVLIVDDNEEFRSVARMLLASGGFDVVGESADGESAVEAVHRLEPDVVVLDVQLPGADGFAVAGHLRHLPHPPRVVLVSSRRAADYGPRLDGPGVHGFISKSELDAPTLGAALG